MKLIHGVLVFLLALLIAAPTTAQSDPFHPILTAGRGIPQRLSWQPDSDLVLVNSITGVWLYSSDDLSDIAHFENLHDAVFSPDGGWLAGVDEQGDTQLYDSNNLNNVALPPSFKDRNFSPDGQWLLGEVDDQPTLLGAPTFQPVDLPTELINALPDYWVWSPDSRKLMAINWENQRIWVWHVGEVSLQFSIQPDISNYPQWSPDSQKISLNERTDNRVHIWDGETGEGLLEIPAQAGHNPNLERASDGALVWLPDGQRFLRFFPSDGSVKVEIYSVAEGKLLAALETRASFNLWYSPNSQRLALTDGLYDLNTYEKIATIQVNSAFPWSPDSRWLALSNLGQAEIYIVDGATGQQVHLLEGQADGLGFPALMWSPDSTKLLSSDYNGQLIIWDALAGEKLASRDDHINVSQFAAFSEDGSLLAASDNIGKVRLWNVQSGELIATMSDHLGEVDTLLWQPNGTLLATQNASGRSSFWNGIDDRNIIYIWNGESGEKVHTITGQTGLTSATWSPDGKQLWFGSEDSNSVQVWDADRKHELMIDIEIGGWLPYPEISWSADGGIMLLEYSYSTHGGQLIHLYDALNGDLLADKIRYYYLNQYAWNTADGKLRLAVMDCPPYSSINCTISIRTLFDPVDYPAHIDINNSLELPADMVLGAYQQRPGFAWSPDGTLMAVSDQQTTWVWAIENTPKHLLLTVPNASFMRWSPDGTSIMTRAVDAQIEVIEIASGEVVLSLPDVNVQGWSPDGDFLDVGEGYAPSFLWSIDAGRQIASLGGRPLLWSADGKRYADLSTGVMRVWGRG